jgi:hypothetical protein
LLGGDSSGVPIKGRPNVDRDATIMEWLEDEGRRHRRRARLSLWPRDPAVRGWVQVVVCFVAVSLTLGLLACGLIDTWRKEEQARRMAQLREIEVAAHLADGRVVQSPWVESVLVERIDRGRRADGTDFVTLTVWENGASRECEYAAERLPEGLRVGDRLAIWSLDGRRFVLGRVGSVAAGDEP